MATSISTTITAEGVGTALKVRKTPRNIVFTVTGPFDGTVVLTEAKAGRGNFRNVPGAGPWTRSLVSQAFTKASDSEMEYKLRLTDANRSVTNGTFASDTGWTKGTGWTIAAGVASSDGSQTGASLLSQTLPGNPLVVGASYSITYTITRSAGTITPVLGGTSGTERSSSDTFTETIVAGSTSVLAFSADADFVGTVDTVTIVPVISYTLSDSDGVVRENRDADGRVFDTVTEDGRTLDGTLTVADGVVAPVTGALTGAVNDVPVAETRSVDPSQKTTFYDDFLGDVIQDPWTIITGTDPQAVAAAVSAGTLNGMARMTSGNSNPGVTAADAAGIVLGRNWQADQGGLVMEARVKLSAITAVKCFIGFTDTIALEFPGVSNGTTGVTWAADDAVGFLFDDAATVDVWAGCGVKATTTGGAVVNGSAPVADTYDILRIELSAAGVASFYQNGTLIGTMSAAVTADALLTPVLIVMEGATANTRSLDVDYVWVQQNR